MNKEIDSKLELALKTYDRRSKSVDIIQPFSTLFHFKENKNIKVQAEQIVMNITH